MSDKTHQKYPVSVQHGKPRLAPLKEGWNRLLISDLVEEVIRPVVMEDDELYTLVTAKRSRGGIVEREKLKGRDIAVKSQFYIREDDFLISKRQIVHGACGFVPKQLDGAIVSNEYLVLNFTDKIIPEFWNFLSYTVYFQQICFHSSIGVHIEKMLFKVEQWYRWKINIPSLEEQEKIASFLGAVDRRLTQLRRKQELLQTYKRGVMQKIFSQEIRFKGAIGSPFPDWEERTLGEITNKIGSGATPRGGEDNYQESGISLFRSMNIYDNRFQEENLAFIDENQARELNNVTVEKDDILLNITGASIARCCIAPVKFLPARVNQHVMIIRPQKNKLNSIFLSNLLVFEDYKNQLFKLGGKGGSTREALTKSHIQNFQVILPSIKEQEKIADFLTAIDRKIETIYRQIEQTEKFKKGLLQKLFI